MLEAKASDVNANLRLTEQELLVEQPYRSRQQERDASMQRVIVRYSIAWLAGANAVGLWLAALLLWPQLGELSGDFGYGRMMPLHMDWQLYGWCSLPLLGLLARAYWDHNDKGSGRVKLGFGLWSLALLVGGGSWLLGEVTGKPFLNWTGFARWFFAIALAAVWLVVVKGLWERWSLEGALMRWGKLGLAVMLAGVPVSLFWVSDATVYPPVDPESGGATGHSLLASTLGIVAIMGLLPRWGLGLQTIEGRTARRGTWVYWVAFGMSIVAYLLIQHGDASNRSLDQIVGLGTLLVWPGLLWYYWSGFAWTRASRVWRVVFLAWWGLLAVDGWVSFLPGVLDIVKFSNAMVAHAHLAMAGMVSALNMVILIELGADRGSRRVLSEGSSVWLWNGALLVFVVTLTIQGFREGLEPGRLFLFDGGTAIFYGIRFVCGTAMLGASVLWLVRLLKREWKDV